MFRKSPKSRQIDAFTLFETLFFGNSLKMYEDDAVEVNGIPHRSGFKNPL
jgi:hypothetical protein